MWSQVRVSLQFFGFRIQQTALDLFIWGFPVSQMVKNPPMMQDTWVWSLGWGDPVENGVATHSSILAWRIPWTEEPGGLQSMGSQRIRYDWVTNTSLQNLYVFLWFTDLWFLVDNLCDEKISIYFWLCRIFVAACGLSLVVASGGYSLVAVRGLLIVMASPVVQQEL